MSDQVSKDKTLKSLGTVFFLLGYMDARMAGLPMELAEEVAKKSEPKNLSEAIERIKSMGKTLPSR